MKPSPGCRNATQRFKRRACGVGVVSGLARYMVEATLIGHYSPQDLQTICALAATDVDRAIAAQDPAFTYTDLDALARLGTNGTYPNNIFSEIMRTISEPKFHAPALTQFPFYLKECESEFHLLDQPILYPHEVFSAMYNHYRGAWEKLICPSRQSLDEYWVEVEDSPALVRHPVKARPQWRRRAVGFTTHGDGVTTIGVGKPWGESIDAITWCSVHGQGPLELRHFLIWFAWKSLCVKEGVQQSMEMFWVELAWSFGVLYSGVWPCVDAHQAPFTGWRANMAGKPLAGESVDTCFFGLLWGMEQDLDFLYNEFDFPRYNAVRGPCGICPATRSPGPMPWDDFAADALWTRHIYTEEEFRAQYPNANPMLSCQPGVSHLMLWPDYMHNKHIGTDTYTYGSALHELCTMSWMVTQARTWK